MRAVVAGAGIGGLAAALALARSGWRVEVIEAAVEVREVGAGLQMSPNAMRVLADLGVAERVEAEGFEPQAAELRHWQTGALHGRVALAGAARARWGAPYIHVHRADLQAALLEAARDAGVAVTVATRVTGYAEGGARVETSDGGRDADLLVGADGIRSAVRAGMLGDAPPRFTGQVAWRATVPVDRLPDGLVPPVAAVFCGPGRHAITYRLRGGALVNLVAVEERDGWAEEDWRQPGDPAELVRAFTGWAPVVAGVVAAVQECHLWGLFDRDPLPRWTDGRVALMGDAAHPMLPFMAQGAAQAIEDAVALARHLSAAATSDGVPGRIAAYAAERRPRTAAIQAASRANARLYHLHGTAPLKLAVLRTLPGLMRARLDPVYGHDAVTGK
jgi:salicylate hydroxylase